VSISNFTELKSSIADFLNRDDLTAVIPTFIKLAEADMNRKLRHWRMESRKVALLDTQYTAFPLDFIEGIRLMLTGANEHRLELISLSELMDKRAADNTAGTPKFYAPVDGSFEVYPTPDQDYTIEMIYYERIESLSSSITTNWALTYYPDIYLYGALTHSAPYLGEDQRTLVWAELYQNAIDGTNSEDKQAKSSGSGHRMRIRSFG
tara:strand:- start:5082 stop:5702 length:621 start_codon:yes stop_codon:yes gene_type:complete